jgi:hypothetical protein
LIAVSLVQTAQLIVASKTVVPTGTVKALKKLGLVSEASFGSRFTRSGPVRQSLVTYLACAGADGGYGYFAPNVPPTYELSYELRYSDGRSEVRIARSSNTALGLRIASLLEQVGGISSLTLREHVLKKFATVFLRQHPDVEKMRVSLWQVTPPTIEQYTQGKRHYPTVLCTYDCNQTPKQQ